MSIKSKMITGIDMIMQVAKIEALKSALTSCEMIPVSELRDLVRNHGLGAIALGEALGITADSSKEEAARRRPRGGRSAAVRSGRKRQPKIMLPRAVSAAIRHLLNGSGKSQKALAEHLEVSPSHLSRALKGGWVADHLLLEAQHLEILDEIASFFNLTLDDIFDLAIVVGDRVRPGKRVPVTEGGVAVETVNYEPTHDVEVVQKNDIEKSGNRSEIDEFDLRILRFLESDGQRRSLSDVQSVIGGESDRVRIGLNRLIESGHVDYDGRVIAKFHAVDQDGSSNPFSKFPRLSNLPQNPAPDSDEEAFALAFFTDLLNKDPDSPEVQVMLNTYHGQLRLMMDAALQLKALKKRHRQ